MMTAWEERIWRHCAGESILVGIVDVGFVDCPGLWRVVDVRLKMYFAIVSDRQQAASRKQ